MDGKKWVGGRGGEGGEELAVGERGRGGEGGVDPWGGDAQEIVPEEGLDLFGVFCELFLRPVCVGC